MNAYFRFKSLRTRLAFWFPVVTMLCLVTVVATLYFQRTAVIRDRAFEKLQIARDLKVRELSGWLEGRIGDLLVAAGDGEIRGLEEVLSEKKDDWSPENVKTVSVARTLLQRLVDNYNAYHELFIVDITSGRVAISSDPSQEGQDKREYPYFIEPKGTKKPFIQDIYNSKTEGKPAMAFSAPIFCSAHDGEHIVGVLVARANLEHVLYPLLQDRTGEGETGETLVVNKDRVAVNELRWYERAPLKLKISTEPAMRAAAGETGIVEAKDYRDEMVFAAYTHIPLMQWGFVVKRDLVEVYAPIRAMLRDMVVLVLLSMLAVLIMSVVLSGTIARPVVGIGTVVRRFTEGDLEARCPAQGADEVATLGSLFNRMAAILSSQMTIQQSTSEITDTMVAADEMESFASGLLMKLIDVSGSHLGAFYMRSEDGQTFKAAASVGLSDESAFSFSAQGHEGELGKTLITHSISIIEEISADTAFTFKTTGGTAIPRQIITVPLSVGGRVMAVVSLATLSAYSETHRQIFKQVQVGMNTGLSNLIANQTTRTLAKELKIRNQELEAQASELRAQASELEAQRIQVQEADRLKSEFLSNMSHELRTPLNSVITLSELMSSRGPGKNKEKDAEYLRIMKQNAYDLLNLINDILDLSKIEAGKMELSLGDFEPGKPLERAIETTHSLAAKKGLELQAQISDLPEMNSDEDKVYQILLNLISNAVKFTESGRIDVEMCGEDGKVVYSVKDTGIGIAAADLTHIFDEFRQVDGSTTRKHEGTGLGLAICQRLAMLLGGEIIVESEKGVGSTFLLSLPSSCPELPQRQYSLPRQASPRPGRMAPRGPSAWKKIVLVVDDEAEVRELIRGHLVGAGYEVVVASNGAEALRLAEKLHPFAITLDVLMPDMDGWEVLRRLKESESARNISVIMVSVSRDKDTGMALGATAYLAKPVSKELLLMELDKLSVRRAIRNILVVDDDSVVREYLSDLLEEEDYRVVTVSGGGDALDTISAYLPDVVVLDLMMPDVDGFTVLNRLKSAPATHDLPVIVLTAKDLTPEERILLAEATERVITKGAMDKSHLLKELEASLAQLEQKAAEKGAQDKPRILVVEDNDVAALQIRTVLEDNGYDVLVATGGAEALATFSQVLPDAVVLDLMMPEIDGFQVLEQIRSTPWTATLPVLVLTAKELTAADRARLKHNDVQEMIQKGAMNRDELVAQVGRLVHRLPMGGQLPPAKKEEGANVVSDSDKSSDGQVSSSEKTILIVEDNPDSMFTITEILDEMGLAYIKAQDGAEGVRMAEEAKPDLIIMDIQLPGLSGLDATKQIRGIEEISKTPIIAMTAKAMKGDKEKTLAAGCDAYMSKPLVASDVRALIRRWLGWQ